MQVFRPTHSPWLAVLRRDARISNLARVSIFQDEGEAGVLVAENAAEAGTDREEAFVEGLPVGDRAEDDDGVAFVVGEEEGELFAEGEAAVVEEAEAAAGEIA